MTSNDKPFQTRSEETGDKIYNILLVVLAIVGVVVFAYSIYALRADAEDCRQSKCSNGRTPSYAFNGQCECVELAQVR